MDFSEVIYAIQHDEERTIQEWLVLASDINADVDSQFGSSALHWACHWKRENIAQVLLSAGANPNMGNAYKATALHWACKEGSLPLTKLLLRWKADPLQRNVNGDLPLDFARQAGAIDIVDLLLGNPSGEEVAKKVEQPAPKLTKLDGLAQKTVNVPSPTETSRSSASVGYTASMASGAVSLAPTHGGMQSLQRAKERAESELKNTQKMVEELKDDCNKMQLEKLQLAAKASAFDQMKEKVSALQKANIGLEVQLRQVNAEMAMNAQKVDAKPVEDTKEQQAKMEELLVEKKRVTQENIRLKETLQQIRQQHAASEDEKDGQLDELRTQVSQLQGLKVRSEIQLREYSELKSTVGELQKDKALLEMELGQVAEMRTLVDELQDLKLKAESEMREAKRTAEELTHANKGLRQQVGDLEGQLKEMCELKLKLESLEKENSRLEIQCQTYSEELENRKELAMNAIRGTEDAVGGLQASLDQLRKEKMALKIELQAEKEASAKWEKQVLDAERRGEEVTSTKESVAVLEQTIESLQKEKDVYKEQLQTLQATHDKSQEQLRDLSKEKVVTEVHLQDYEKIKEELESVNGQYIQLQVEMKRSSLELDTLRQTMDSMASDKNYMETQMHMLEDLRDAYAKLEAEHQIARESASKNQAELERMGADKGVWEAQFMAQFAPQKKELEMRAAAGQHEAHRLQVEVKALVDQLLQAQQTIGNLTNNNVAMEANTIAQLRQQLSALKQKEAQWESYANSYEGLRRDQQQLAEAQDQLQARERDIAELSNTINDLKARLKTVNDQQAIDRKHVDQKLDTLQKQWGSEQHQMREAYEEELERVRLVYDQEAEGLRQRAAIMNNERDALQLQIKALQDQATFAVENATRKSLFEPAKLDTSKFDISAKGKFGFGATDPKLSSVFNEISELRSSSLPPLNKTAPVASPVFGGAVARSKSSFQPKPGTFAREQKGLRNSMPVQYP